MLPHERLSIVSYWMHVFQQFVPRGSNENKIWDIIRVIPCQTQKRLYVSFDLKTWNISDFFNLIFLGSIQTLTNYMTLVWHLLVASQTLTWLNGQVVVAKPLYRLS